MTVKKTWILWFAVTLLVAGFYSYKIFIDTDKPELLIGAATHGHFQIELSCTACHTEAFGGEEMIQNACLNCHQAELEEANDSHPKKKFNDPRNADRLAGIDARYCVSCHTEHQDEQTHPMGLTLPEDYCFHCHQDIGEDRPSHQDLAFDSCASAGCHNYHDNRALYETFLVENAEGEWLSHIAAIAAPNSARLGANKSLPAAQLAFADISSQHPAITDEWAASGHADAGINCGGCHADTTQEWIEKPDLEQCQTCHTNEAEGFLQGKHGMRMAQDLPAITPGDSSLAFRNDAKDVQHGCTTCHGAHSFDTTYAAKQGCLACHSDEHSLSFDASPHGQLALQVENGNIKPEESVTCATCHMPRDTKIVNGTEIVRVIHNQNANLRPNEKMIRPVCMQCHSLAFSIDALADEALIRNNFSGQPEVHVPSIDWALKRVDDE